MALPEPLTIGAMGRIRSLAGNAARFAASVLAVTGALLIADAVTTLLWQEPLSALTAARGQSELERSLELPSDAAQQPVSPERLAALARAHPRPRAGSAFGRIVLPSLERSYTTVEGTRTEDLRLGPGHYRDTAVPGAGGTAAIAGHRTTYGAPFRTIDRLAPGDPVEVRMPYARLRYRIEAKRIVSPRAVWVIEPRGYERLVLTACHPLYSAAQRVVVFARLERATTSPAGRPAAPGTRAAARATGAQPGSVAGGRRSGT